MTSRSALPLSIAFGFLLFLGAPACGSDEPATTPDMGPEISATPGQGLRCMENADACEGSTRWKCENVMGGVGTWTSFDCSTLMREGINCSCYENVFTDCYTAGGDLCG